MDEVKQVLRNNTSTFRVLEVMESDIPNYKLKYVNNGKNGFTIELMAAIMVFGRKCFINAKFYVNIILLILSPFILLNLVLLFH